jgi:hypothetical protein
MLEHIIGRAPEGWRELAAVFLAPVLWIPRLQRVLIDFFVDSSFGWTATAKCVLLVLPAVLVLVAVWCTQLSLYTLPFRSRRVRFLATLLLTWWDALRAVLMYCAAVVRAVIVLLGWAVTGVTLAVGLVFAALRHLMGLPASATSRMTASYFRPGMPWVALMLLVLWCALEATVFTYTVLPTLSDSLAEFVRVEQLPRSTRPIVWIFLFVMIMGSFICIQVLLEAIKNRQFALIGLIVLVELFVMFFEVAFLYRELAEAATPWLVQESGGTFRPGLWLTLSMARFGWMATRGMAWFLFGQYGTPPLLAVISRQAMTIATSRPAAATPRPAAGQKLLQRLQGNAWLHQRGDELLTDVGVPVLNLVAAALNFAMVLVSAQPLFGQPFQGLEWRRQVIRRRPATGRL